MRSVARSLLSVAALAMVAVAGCGGTAESPTGDPTEVEAPGTTGVPTSDVGSVHGESYPKEADGVGTIDAIESGFNAAFGDSYSFVVEYRKGSKLNPDCDLWAARVVVVDGAVTDAAALPTPLRDACRIDVEDAPTAAEVFDIARTLSGSSEVSIGTNPDDETSMWLRATEGDDETRLSIEQVSKSTAPTSVGWEEVDADAAAARRRWDEQSFDYSVTVESYGFQAQHSERVTTVVDGEPMKVVEYGDLGNDDAGEEVDPARWAELGIPLTVDDVLDIVDDQDRAGYVAAVFDSDTGAPIALWTDSDPEGIDDEVAIFVTVERL